MTKIENLTKLLALREKLNQIQNYGYSFYQLNKRYPISNELRENQAHALITYYEDLIDKIKKLVD